VPIDFSVDRVAATLHGRATAGADRAGRFLADKARQTLGRQAPLRPSRRGRPYAATRATPGAPPRRVTGRLLASVRYDADRRTGKVRVLVNTPGQFLERGGHAFLGPVLRRHGGEAARIALGIA
jgi:hypothetical protein